MDSSQHPRDGEPREPNGTETIDADSPEVGISSLVDGELPAGGTEGLLQLIDRLVDSPDLRRQYRDARSLDGLLETLEPTADAEPPYEVWQGIAAATQQPDSSRRWGSRRSSHVAARLNSSPGRATPGVRVDRSPETTDSWGRMSLNDLAAATNSS